MFMELSLSQLDGEGFMFFYSILWLNGFYKVFVACVPHLGTSHVSSVTFIDLQCLLGCTFERYQCPSLDLA